MPCFHPLGAWKKAKGGVSFSPKGSVGDTPLQLPCGQCIGCRIAKSQQWAIRCVHEAQLHDRNSFITLTYDQEHLPKDNSLDIRHWQLFAKKLRHRIGSFRFFHCGEYGELNKRPHYHACIFGVDFSGDRQPLKKTPKHTLYTSALLEEVWGRGFCTVGELTYESAAYVARYVLKKITGAAAERHYKGRKPEYITMSRNKGIGSEWLERYSGDVYPSDEVIYKGRRFRPPRFYDEQQPEQELEEIKLKRKEKVLKRGKDLTPKRLIVREKVLEEKIKQLERII